MAEAPRSTRSADGSFWRRLASVGVLVLTLPMTWLQAPGCEAQESLVESSGHAVLTGGEDGARNVLVIGGALVLCVLFALLARWVPCAAGRVLLQLLTMTASTYAALHIHLVTSADTIAGITVRMPAWIAAVAAGYSALDAIWALLNEVVAWSRAQQARKAP